MPTDWLTVALALAVLVVPMLMAWAILSWSDRHKPKDNDPSFSNDKHGKYH
ncbi:MAG: hypothetical protein U5M53_07470 [Rhodoferax sp.]|nr:hypothetical protein [Rhodoferax sp.]